MKGAFAIRVILHLKQKLARYVELEEIVMKLEISGNKWNNSLEI